MVNWTAGYAKQSLDNKCTCCFSGVRAAPFGSLFYFREIFYSQTGERFRFDEKRLHEFYTWIYSGRAEADQAKTTSNGSASNQLINMHIRYYLYVIVS